jgi:hypothetical protein
MLLFFVLGYRDKEADEIDSTARLNTISGSQDEPRDWWSYTMNLLADCRPIGHEALHGRNVAHNGLYSIDDDTPSRHDQELRTYIWHAVGIEQCSRSSRVERHWKRQTVLCSISAIL